MQGRKHVLAVLVAAVFWGVSAVSAETADGIFKELRKRPDDVALMQNLKGSLAGVANADERCRLGTVYCLGILAYGDVDEGLSVRERMRKAFPSQASVMELSDEKIYDDCPKCEGGKTQGACPKCSGSKSCAVCGGGGKSKSKGFNGGELACPACRGSGTCAQCAGTGQGVRTCTSCYGRGNSLAKDKCRENFLRLLQPDAGAVFSRASGGGATAADPFAAPLQKTAEDADQFSPAASRRADEQLRAANTRRDGGEKSQLEQLTERMEAAERVRLQIEEKRNLEAKTTAERLKQQMSRSPLARQYPITLEDIERATSSELTQVQRNKVLQELWDRAKSHQTNPKVRGLFMPFPSGLKYTVLDVTQDRHGDYTVSLESDEKVVDTIAEMLAPSGFLRLNRPKLLVPSTCTDVAEWGKNQVITTGAWMITVLITDDGRLYADRYLGRSDEEEAYFEQKQVAAEVKKDAARMAKGLESQPQAQQSRSTDQQVQELNASRKRMLKSEVDSLRNEVQTMRNDRPRYPADSTKYDQRLRDKEQLLNAKETELYRQ